MALLMALMPCVAGAAGMGRINVLSTIGQPLLVEIELTVTNEEMTSLDARLALPDAYQQANLQYNPALAGARLTIEKRPNGTSFLKIASTRPVTEPFIDLLVHLTWTAGRLSREYTALLDPPRIQPVPVPAPSPVISALPQPRPAPAAEAPDAAATPAPAPAAPVLPAAPLVSKPVSPAPEPAAAAAAPASPVPAATKGVEYGPVERGDTLGKIAQSVKPDGVTLEQMLVALYRSNPEAFIQKNLNLVRTGKILRVPGVEEVEAISRIDAVQEYRTHVADWNAYRQKVADAAGTVPAEGRTAVSGKISTTVEDKAAAGAPKDVVKLSKGEPPAGTASGKGKPGTSAERVRMLEEEVVSREKALAEANSRITQLEKSVKDMQKLAELKSPGMAAAPKSEVKPAPKPEAANPEMKKQEAAKPAPTVQPEAAKPAAVAAAEAPASAEKPAVVQPEPAKPLAAPDSKPKPAAAPQRPEPDLMDKVLAAATDPLYLAVGGGVILLGGLGFWLARRRRTRASDYGPPIAPTLSEAAAAAAGAAAMTGEASAAMQTSMEPAADEVDPLAEAEVYIQYGRDGQAEEILKEALATNPRRGDVQLKLLEIYSARKDRAAFGKLAADYHKLTGATGDNWLKAAAMGYALDPGNVLYEAGKGAAVSTMAHDSRTSTDVDLDIGPGGSTSTDITLEAEAAVAASGFDSTIVDLGAMDVRGMSAPATGTSLPDFTLDVPPAGGNDQPDVSPRAAPPARESNLIDFHIDLPKASSIDPPTVTPASGKTDSGIDFKLEGLNLSLDGEPKSKGNGGGGEKDGHWYDVQTKFDLAKAYQEMGDRDGAKEILQEVIKEGDADQRAQASTLMDSLG